MPSHFPIYVMPMQLCIQFAALFSRPQFKKPGTCAGLIEFTFKNRCKLSPRKVSQGRFVPGTGSKRLTTKYEQGACNT